MYRGERILDKERIIKLKNITLRFDVFNIKIEKS